MNAGGIDQIAMQDFDAKQVLRASHSPHSHQTRNGLASETGTPTVEKNHKRWGCSGEVGSEAFRAAHARRCESSMGTVENTMRETWWEYAKRTEERAEKEGQERDAAGMGNYGCTYADHTDGNSRTPLMSERETPICIAERSVAARGGLLRGQCLMDAQQVRRMTNDAPMPPSGGGADGARVRLSYCATDTSARESIRAGRRVGSVKRPSRPTPRMHSPQSGWEANLCTV